MSHFPHIDLSVLSAASATPRRWGGGIWQEHHLRCWTQALLGQAHKLRQLSSTKAGWTAEEDRAMKTLLTSCLKKFGTAAFKQSGRIFFNKSWMWQLHFLYCAGKRITVYLLQRQEDWFSLGKSVRFLDLESWWLVECLGLIYIMFSFSLPCFLNFSPLHVVLMLTWVSLILNDFLFNNYWRSLDVFDIQVKTLFSNTCLVRVTWLNFTFMRSK